MRSRMLSKQRGSFSGVPTDRVVAPWPSQRRSVRTAPRIKKTGSVSVERSEAVRIFGWSEPTCSRRLAFIRSSAPGLLLALPLGAVAPFRPVMIIGSQGRPHLVTDCPA